jgi:transposase-like protein
MDQAQPRGRRRLSAEDKWQIFTEASAKDAKVADVLRRWRIDSSQLARIRTQVKEGALTLLKKGPGRNPKDEEKEALKAEVSRLEDAFKEVSIREHPATKKIRLGLTGAIRGARSPAEIKLALIGAITEAKETGFPVVRACEVLMLQPRRFHRWLKARDPKALTAEDVTDETRERLRIGLGGTTFWSPAKRRAGEGEQPLISS